MILWTLERLLNRRGNLREIHLDDSANTRFLDLSRGGDGGFFSLLEAHLRQSLDFLVPLGFGAMLAIFLPGALDDLEDSAAARDHLGHGL